MRRRMDVMGSRVAKWVSGRSLVSTPLDVTAAEVADTDAQPTTGEITMNVGRHTRRKAVNEVLRLIMATVNNAAVVF